MVGSISDFGMGIRILRLRRPAFHVSWNSQVDKIRNPHSEIRNRSRWPNDCSSNP